mgnify:CR=1 FL=1
MKLRDYLHHANDGKGITGRAFAKTIGIGEVYLSGIVNGTKRPGLHLATHIEMVTNGAVKVNDLMNDVKRDEMEIAIFIESQKTAWISIFKIEWLN